MLNKVKIINGELQEGDIRTLYLNDSFNGSHIGLCKVFEILGELVHLVDNLGNIGSYGASQLEFSYIEC